MSFLVMRPRIRRSASTSGSFSTRRPYIRRSASSIEMSGGPVTSRSNGVMNSSTGRSSCAGLHGQSRFDRSPARMPLPGASSIRRPVTLCRRASSRASRTLAPRASMKGRSTT